VVATDLPALAELRHLFRTAENAEQMIAEIDRVLAEPDRKALPIDDPILRAHSWGSRLDAMLAIVHGGR
jgi:pimeloyl-ACP methyl ester carboxylesterase